MRSETTHSLEHTVRILHVACNTRPGARICLERVVLVSCAVCSREGCQRLLDTMIIGRPWVSSLCVVWRPASTWLVIQWVPCRPTFQEFIICLFMFVSLYYVDDTGSYVFPLKWLGHHQHKYNTKDKHTNKEHSIQLNNNTAHTTTAYTRSTYIANKQTRTNAINKYTNTTTNDNNRHLTLTYTT